jgi:hypothetical protein
MGHDGVSRQDVLQLRHGDLVKRIGLLFLVAVQGFLLYAVRLREQLTCSAAIVSPQLECRRSQTKLVGSRDESFDIPDAQSVTFHVRSHTTASHARVNTSSIDAVDNTGRRVTLLSIGDRETADAERFEHQLRELAQARPPEFSFARDESRTAWLFLGISAAWWLAYLGLSRYSANTSRSSHSA